MGGRVALVTGASRGIGRAVAMALAADGHRGGRLLRLRRHRRRRRRERPSRAWVVRRWRCRSTSSRKDSVDAAFTWVEDTWGKVEVLVSNAGIARDGLLLRMSDDQWAEVMHTNLDGAFHLLRRATPGMVRARWGRIVLVGSVVGLSGSAGQANYAAAKAGLVGLTRSVARELGARGITANLVAPRPHRHRHDRRAGRGPAVADGADRFRWPGSVPRRRSPRSWRSCAPTGPAMCPGRSSRSTAAWAWAIEPGPFHSSLVAGPGRLGRAPHEILGRVTVTARPLAATLPANARPWDDDRFPSA